MKTNPWLAAAIAPFLFVSTSLPKASAELPMLQDQEWLGFYAVSKSKRCQFTITPDGKIVLTPMNSKGALVAKTQAIDIAFGVEEILPDGKFQMKQIKGETLESTDEATDDLEKIVIRGKATGDASFEMTLEQERGIISIGGRLIDPGTLKNPARFAVSLKFPSLYDKDKKEEKKELKAFEKKVKGDSIELKWTDGKRHKEDFLKPLDATTAELNGPGIAAAEIEAEAYKGIKFLINASDNSSMTIANARTMALHEGFSLTWRPDAAKDPKGEARVGILVK